MSIDQKQILTDVVNTSDEFLTGNIDVNLLSGFGWLATAMSSTINNTYQMARWRAKNSIVELSDDFVNMKTVANIKGISVRLATQADAGFLMMIKVKDILERGEIVGVNTKKITINKLSSISCNGIKFSLTADLDIEVSKFNNSNVIAVSQMNMTTNELAYIKTQYFTDSDGDSAFGITLMCEQINYNVAQKNINDITEFTYSGIPFYYDNFMCNLKIEYRKSSTDSFKELTPVYYQLGSTSSSEILYNADREGCVYVLNNPLIGLDDSCELRVTISETLGSAGNFQMGMSESTFTMYNDETKDYSTISIGIDIVSDSQNGLDGITQTELKRAIINNKYGENTITDMDVSRYLDTVAPDVYSIKKRNDLYDRLLNHYYVLRDDSGNPMPTTTMKLIVNGDSEFDKIHTITKRKVIKANNMFTLADGTGELTKKIVSTVENPVDVAAYESNKDKLLLNCPFSMVINGENILSYYYSTISKNIEMEFKSIYDHPYQFFARQVYIGRNSIANIDDDLYSLSVETILNTPDNIGMLDDNGNLTNPSKSRCFIVLYNTSGKSIAYLELILTSYDKSSGKYKFTGGFRTTDYTTINRELEISSGLKTSGATTDFLSVIPYTNLKFKMVFLYEEAPTNTSDVFYSEVPGMSNYSLCCSYENVTECNIVYEVNSFMRSPVTLVDNGNSTFHYEISEVPFIKYSYSLANYSLVYEKLNSIRDKYVTMVKLLGDFGIILKFSRTYGKSHYIKIGDEDLNDLNPNLTFKIYGSADVDAIKAFIKKFFNGFENTNPMIFLTNLITALESNFAIKSAQFVSINSFDAKYSVISYNQPDLTVKANRMKFIPEYMTIGNIDITLIDSL